MLRQVNNKHLIVVSCWSLSSYFAHDARLKETKEKRYRKEHINPFARSSGLPGVNECCTWLFLQSDSMNGLHSLVSAKYVNTGCLLFVDSLNKGTSVDRSSHQQLSPAPHRVSTAWILICLLRAVVCVLPAECQ